MKRLSRFLIAGILISQQALGSVPVYQFPQLPEGGAVTPESPKTLPFEPLGPGATHRGQEVLILVGNQAFRGQYEGPKPTVHGEIEHFTLIDFLGWAKTPKDAQDLADANPRIEISDIEPPQMPPTEVDVDANGSPNLSGPLDAFVGNAVGIGMRGAENGAIAGVAVALNKGLIHTKDVRQYFADRQTEVEVSNQNIKASQTRVDETLNQANQNFMGFVNNLNLMLQNPAIAGGVHQATSARPQQFKSKNQKFVGELKSTLNVLDSSPGQTDVQRAAQQMGYAFVAEADTAYSKGSFTDAYAYRNYALAAADLAVGWDPVTGVVRSVYEGFTGLNMITGEQLTLTEQSFAVLGVVTFGYGNKIGQGFRAVRQFASKMRLSQRVSQAIGRAEHLVKNNFVTKHYRGKGLDQYYDQLRVKDPEAYQNLRNYFDSNPEKKEKYLSLLKERESLEIQYWFENGEYEIIRQERSPRALEELEKALNPDSVLVRYGGDDWTPKKKWEYIQRHGEAPGYSSRVNVGFSDPKEAPVHWTLVRKDIGDEVAREGLGLYSRGDAFKEYAKLKPDAKIVTRTAGSGTIVNPISDLPTVTKGGAIEVVVSPGGADTIKFEAIK